MPDLKERQFLVRVILKQVVEDSKTFVIKDGEELTYGKDIIPTLANLFNSTKIFVEKKLKIETPKSVIVK